MQDSRTPTHIAAPGHKQVPILGLGFEILSSGVWGVSSGFRVPNFMLRVSGSKFSEGVGVGGHPPCPAPRCVRPIACFSVFRFRDSGLVCCVCVSCVSLVSVWGLLGPVDPSFRALSGRLESTVRRHKFNKDSLFGGVRTFSRAAMCASPSAFAACIPGADLVSTGCMALHHAPCTLLLEQQPEPLNRQPYPPNPRP